MSLIGIDIHKKNIERKKKWEKNSVCAMHQLRNALMTNTGIKEVHCVF